MRLVWRGRSTQRGWVRLSHLILWQGRSGGALQSVQWTVLAKSSSWANCGIWCEAKADKTFVCTSTPPYVREVRNCTYRAATTGDKGKSTKLKAVALAHQFPFLLRDFEGPETMCRTMKRLILISTMIVMILVNANTLAAQLSTRRAIILKCDANDTTGKTFCRLLRDEIARSPRYQEIPSTPANLKRFFTLDILTVQGTPEDNVTAMSIAYLFDTTYLNHIASVCGKTKVQECAAETLDNVDDFLSQK